jgi:uncharacterized protein YidB (DUF937 family)
MGLLDVLNGMQNGPRGQTQPNAGSRSGMSPITMALLGLLAYKAVKKFSGASAGAPSSAAGTSPGGGVAADGPSGGMGGSLGDLLSGGLGRLLGGASAGSILSGGLGNLVKDLENSGQGQVAQSWIGNGPNQAISPASLESAVGSDTIDQLSKKTGMDRNELLGAMSQYLPGLVDHLTPNGRLPTESEAAHMSS